MSHHSLLFDLHIGHMGEVATQLLGVDGPCWIHHSCSWWPLYLHHYRHLHQRGQRGADRWNERIVSLVSDVAAAALYLSDGHLLPCACTDGR